MRMATSCASKSFRRQGTRRPWCFTRWDTTWPGTAICGSSFGRATAARRFRNWRWTIRTRYARPWSSTSASKGNGATPSSNGCSRPARARSPSSGKCASEIRRMGSLGAQRRLNEILSRQKRHVGEQEDAQRDTEPSVKLPACVGGEIDLEHRPYDVGPREGTHRTSVRSDDELGSAEPAAFFRDDREEIAGRVVHHPVVRERLLDRGQWRVREAVPDVELVAQSDETT